LLDSPQLGVLARDGTRAPCGTWPKEIWNALRALDPERHRYLELVAESVQVRVWPRPRIEGEPVPLVCLQAQLDGREAWLGREHAARGFQLDGQPMPPHLEVPITWASSTLSTFLQGGKWPRHFPWHEPGSWQPQGEWRADEHSYALAAALPDDEARLGWVGELHAKLIALVAEDQEPRAAFATAIAELRRLGHDLWSWDDDGESELWGHDYMRATVGRGLRLCARYQPELELGVRFGAARAGSIDDDE
jgi:hypothetical protein